MKRTLSVNELHYGCFQAREGITLTGGLKALHSPDSYYSSSLHFDPGGKSWVVSCYSAPRADCAGIQRVVQILDRHPRPLRPQSSVDDSVSSSRHGFDVSSELKEVLRTAQVSAERSKCQLRRERDSSMDCSKRQLHPCCLTAPCPCFVDLERPYLSRATDYWATG